MASRIEGIPRLHRLLKRLPDDITGEVKFDISQGAQQILANAKGNAPAKSVAEALTMQIAPDGLSAKIGLIGKGANRKGFLGHFFEFGTKAHTISAKGRKFTPKGRRSKKGGAQVLVSAKGEFFGTSVVNPGMARKPWFYAPARSSLRTILVNIGKAVGRALSIASGGS